MNTGSEITVNTVQGIGDIFWVYQKFAPYFDVININILCTKLNPVQARAQKFCKMLPKVRSATLTKVPGEVYKAVASSKYRVCQALDESIKFMTCGQSTPSEHEVLNLIRFDPAAYVEYAVNLPLETGVRLEDVDPGSEVEWFVDMGLPKEAKQEDYICVFIAGAKMKGLWRTARWVKMIKLLSQKLGTKRIKFIGAQWDIKAQQKVQAELIKDPGFDVTSVTAQLSLAESIDVIRRSKFFLGYQSGLNIIAENYNVPQLMIYFTHLKPMMYTWCKKESINTRFFASTFDQTPKKIMELLS